MQEPGIFRPKHQGFGKFIYNSEKGEVLGRTGLSWLKITVFYIIFYACLAAFFAAMMAVLYQSLDTENRPTYTPGSGGSVLKNPALGFRPRPRSENVESTLIWYKNGITEDTDHWSNQLTSFIENYEGTDDDGQHTRACSFADYEREIAAEKNGTKRDRRACQVKDTSVNGGYCNKADRWGYDRDSPCVLLKLNRMINWEPDVYTSVEDLPELMPEYLKLKIKNETKFNNKMLPMVWVSCQGENPADFEYLPKIELFPTDGFPAYYFPYTKTPGYRSPLVSVFIHTPEPNVLINIECRVWAKNINHDRGNRLGMVHFELLKD